MAKKGVKPFTRKFACVLCMCVFVSASASVSVSAHRRFAIVVGGSGAVEQAREMATQVN